MRAENLPGRGARFTAWVRCEDAATTTHTRDPRRAVAVPTDTGPSSLQGRRYLVAEDGLDNLRLITAFLTGAGAEVESAANGIDALRTIHVAGPNAFDAILMDLNMPIMGGHEATRLLRARECTTPIIALTASDTAEDRAHCAAEGFDHFLTKPVSKATLISTLSSLPRRPG